MHGQRHPWHVEEVPNDRRLRGVNPLVENGVTILAPALPLALIHRSAWKRNYRKSVCDILYSPALVREKRASNVP
jgi:hypothetical protein